MEKYKKVLVLGDPQVGKTTLLQNLFAGLKDTQIKETSEGKDEMDHKT
jgi:GTPase SAR1 family protein